jgi:Matrixin
MLKRSLLPLTALVTALATAPAQAYELNDGQRPFGPEISYHNTAPAHDWALSKAVRAWNSSGADVKLFRVSRSQADVVVVPGPVGIKGNTRIHHRSDSQGNVSGGAELELPGFAGEEARARRFLVAQIAAHELGHVLGLAHEDSGCATMNSTILNEVPQHCPQPPSGQWRCRLLEEDDIRGAVSIHGGTVRGGGGPAYCDRSSPATAARPSPTDSSTASVPSTSRPSPPPPTGLEVTLRPSDGDVLELRWTNATRPGVASVVVADAPYDCPKAPRGHDPEVVDASPGQPQSIERPVVLESHCFAAWSRDVSGRLSRVPATVRFEPPSVPDPPRDVGVFSAPTAFLGPLVHWRNPPGDTLKRVIVARSEGECPSSPPEHPAPGTVLRATSDELQAYQDLRFLGVADDSCYALWAQDRFGRLSGAATFSHESGPSQEARLGE